MRTGSRRRMAAAKSPHRPGRLQRFNSVYNLCATSSRLLGADLMDLRDPEQFSRAYDEHHRAVYAAAQRVLGDHALAGDLGQDVFLSLWRRPPAFDAARGDLGTYLRLMARSRAVDLWREGQSRGRATDRFKVVVAEEEPRHGDRPDDALERNA